MSSVQPAFVPPTPFAPSAPAPRLRSSARTKTHRPTRTHTRSRTATAVLPAVSQSQATSTSKSSAAQKTRPAGESTAVRKPRPTHTMNPDAPVLSPTALKRHLAEQRDDDLTVVKVFAKYCPSCRGAAAPFRKVVAAYADEDVSFASLDFTEDEEFARGALGVDNLPYFAVFRGTTLMGGSAMGWRGLGSRLVERIEAVRDASH